MITRYNNKTYRIDEVLWDRTPNSTFKLSSGKEIAYKNYYMENWNKKVTNTTQPLLLHHSTRRVSGKPEPEVNQLCFIPEFCHLTGLTDTMRNDFKVMKDIATYTRVTPNQR